MSIEILARSRFQIFIIDVPELKAGELEVALRNKVRSLTPLHESQYRLWFHLEKRHSKTSAYVFLTKPVQESFRTEFPFRTSGGPQDQVATLLTSEGELKLLYRRGLLQQVGSLDASVRWEERWGAESLPCVRMNPPGMVPSPTSTIVPTRVPWGAMVVCAFLIITILTGLVLQIDAKTQRNASWKSWLKENGASIPGTVPDQMRQMAGIPLDQLMNELATAWPSGVLVQRLQIDGLHLLVEVDSPSAVAAFQALSKMNRLKVSMTGSKGLTPGQERLFAEGEWIGE